MEVKTLLDVMRQNAIIDNLEKEVTTASVSVFRKYLQYLQLDSVPFVNKWLSWWLQIK